MHPKPIEFSSMENSINDVLKILYSIPEKYITINGPATEDSIRSFESKWNVTLPSEYKHLIKQCNGINLMGSEILGLPIKDTRYFSIDDAYQFEHFEVCNPMPLHLIPFSPDGGGNHYCFDTRDNNIVFWDSEYDYTNDTPEVVNNTLAEMIREVFLDWTLEDIDLS